VAQTICGLRQKVSGEIYYKQELLKIEKPIDAIEQGLVYLTEDRKALGLFLDLSIKMNIEAMRIRNVSRRGLVYHALEEKHARFYVDMLGIRCLNVGLPVSSLSGGNQQKVLIAKLLTIQPKILIMDEPTRGIDVGAKAEIHKLLRRFVSEGMGVILISSELPEVIGMCDRVMVMHEGAISGEVGREEMNEKRIIQLASGIREYNLSEKV